MSGGDGDDLPKTFDPLFDAKGPVFQLPSGVETDDPELAVASWRVHAQEQAKLEAACCYQLCLERAKAHQRTLEAGVGVPSDLTARIAEATKCARAILEGVRPDGDPTTALSSARASWVAGRDQLVAERDAARAALDNIYASHRALLTARDENSVYILALRDRVWALEAAIRKHRDQEGDDRCFEDDYELYAVLPEGFDKTKLRLNEPAVMLEYCRRFVEARHDPALPYRSPQREIDGLRARVAALELGIKDLSAQPTENVAAKLEALLKPT